MNEYRVTLKYEVDMEVYVAAESEAEAHRLAQYEPGLYREEVCRSPASVFDIELVKSDE